MHEVSLLVEEGWRLDASQWAHLSPECRLANPSIASANIELVVRYVSSSYVSWSYVSWSYVSSSYVSSNYGIERNGSAMARRTNASR